MAVSTTPSPTPTSNPNVPPPPAIAKPQAAEEEEEEEDYMSMTITEPALPKTTETYTQRRLRKQRETEAKSHPPPKCTLAALAAQTRTTALSTALPQTPTNKGFAIMAKLGYRPGASLGAGTAVDARTQPLELVVKDDRGGIGLDSERKRKVREEAEREGKRVRADEGAYRERVRSEREGRRVEGMVLGAMGVVERLDCEAVELEHEREGGVGEGRGDGDAQGEKRVRSGVQRPTRSVNVLYRVLVRRREEKERERRVRYDLLQSLSRSPTYADGEADGDDRLAVGVVEEEVEEEDAELEAFEALEPAERLRRLVSYLRGRYRYCFWCKCGYPDEGMEGCPGITEDDHD